LFGVKWLSSKGSVYFKGYTYISSYHESIMKLVKILLFALLFSTVLSGCNQKEKNTTEQWQVDEVLLHLSELRKEVVSLRKQVKILTKDVSNINPDVSRQAAINLPLDNQMYLGDESAELAIVEFSDFQCPYCVRHAKKVYPELKKSFVETGKVKYFVRHFPLSFHAQARNAAVVAECAGKQGKQWLAHEYLFENSRQLGDDFFDGIVDEFGLNKIQFDNCRNDKIIAEKIDADMSLGQKNGVSGTPKFFIGRIKNNKLVDAIPLSGAQSYQVFERIINTFNKKS